jgi:hypothetical protein
LGVTLIQKAPPKKRADGEATGASDEVESFKTTYITGASVYMTERHGRVDSAITSESYALTIETAHEGIREVMLEAATITGAPVTFSQWLGSVGIMPDDTANTPKLLTYLRSWRNHLAENVKMTPARQANGWNSDGSITLGDREYSATGIRVVPTTLVRRKYVTPQPENTTAAVAEWVATTKKMYPRGRKGVESQQFMILAAMAAPLYSKCANPTTRGGMLHYYTNASGAGKSGAVRRGLSALGRPEQFMSASKTSLTSFGVRAGELNSFPLYVDETTKLNKNLLSDLVFQSTDGKQKDRSESGGGTIKDQDNAEWNSYTISTANKSLIETISTSGDANREVDSSSLEGARMRILELHALDVTIDLEMQGEENSNPGCLAPLILQYLAREPDLIEKHKAYRVQFVRDIKELADERYRVGMSVPPLMLGDYLVSIGILDFDMTAVRAYAQGSIVKLRTEATQNKSTGAQALVEYVNANLRNILTSENSVIFAESLPVGGVLGRIAGGKLVVPRTAFNGWLAAHGYNLKWLEAELTTANMKKTTSRLLRGTKADNNHAINAYEFTYEKEENV